MYITFITLHAFPESLHKTSGNSQNQLILKIVEFLEQSGDLSPIFAAHTELLPLFITIAGANYCCIIRKHENLLTGVIAVRHLWFQEYTMFRDSAHGCTRPPSPPPLQFHCSHEVCEANILYTLEGQYYWKLLSYNAPTKFCDVIR